jgi:hypothetical protein
MVTLIALGCWLWLARRDDALYNISKGEGDQLDSQLSQRGRLLIIET